VSLESLPDRREIRDRLRAGEYARVPRNGMPDYVHFGWDDGADELIHRIGGAPIGRGRYSDQLLRWLLDRRSKAFEFVGEAETRLQTTEQPDLVTDGGRDTVATRRTCEIGFGNIGPMADDELAMEGGMCQADAVGVFEVDNPHQDGDSFIKPLCETHRDLLANGPDMVIGEVDSPSDGGGSRER